MKILKISSKVICAKKRLNGFTKQKKMNMSNQQYFYIISGLPDISITDVSLPFNAKDFLAEVKNNIEEKDFALVCWLYYPRDNHNLLSILLSKNNMLQPEGCYSLQELKKGIDGNACLPHYMTHLYFILQRKQNPLYRSRMGKINSQKHISKKQ